MILFGKSGKDLIPLLNEGKGGLEDMSRAAEKMGLVISEKTSAQSQKLIDNLKLLDLAKQGLVNTVTAAVLPAMVRLSEQWVDTAKKGDAMRIAAENIVGAIKQLVFGGFAAIELNDLLGKSFIALQEAVTSFPNIEKSQAAVQRFREIWASIEPTLLKLRFTVNALFQDIATHGKDQIDPKFDAALQKAIDDLSFKTRVLNGDFDKLAKGFPEAARALGLFGTAANENRTTVEQLIPKLQELNAAQLAFLGAQTTEQNLLPWESYSQTLGRLQQQLDAGAISQDTFGRAAKKAADSAGLSWTIAGKSIADSFTEAAGTFGDANSTIVKTAKAFAAVQALIAAYAGSAEALAGPFPANLAASALVLAKGLAAVASIKSVAIPGAAKGGLIQCAWRALHDRQHDRAAEPGFRRTRRHHLGERRKSRAGPRRRSNPRDRY
jgi:hypothetical protein